MVLEISSGSRVLNIRARWQFDNSDALLAARQSPQLQASAEDEVNFIDHNKAAYFVSEEHVIKYDNADGES